MIREAEGEAEAIPQGTDRQTQTSIRLIREAGADQAVLALKSFEAIDERRQTGKRQRSSFRQICRDLFAASWKRSQR